MSNTVPTENEIKPDFTETYNSLIDLVDVEGFDFGEPGNRLDRLRDFAIELTEAGKEKILPNALHKACLKFFGREDALVPVAGGSRYPEPGNSAMLSKITAPNYSPTRGENLTPLQDLSPQFIAKSFIYTIAAYSTEYPAIQMHALGVRTLKELFKLEESSDVNGATELLKKDVLDRKYDSFIDALKY